MKLSKMNLSALKDWLKDISTRLNAQKDFAKLVKGKVDPAAHFLWADGRYILLHFDLVNVNAKGTEVHREDVYADVGEVVEANHGVRLGGSVYVIPLLPAKTSECCATEFWNVLADKTAGKLRYGDAFYLHYAPDLKNLLGGITQIVPANKKSLGKVQVPDA